jgi:hypothetical protein
MMTKNDDEMIVEALVLRMNANRVTAALLGEAHMINSGDRVTTGTAADELASDTGACCRCAGACFV